MLVQRTPPPPARDRDALIVRPSAGKKSRLLSLDAFRGFTMVGMILVDNQGNFDYVYEQLNENIWDGLRFCNLVFPWFITMMGLMVPVSLRSERDKLSTAGQLRVLRRGVLLFGIGLLLNALGGKFHHHLRIFGVLQRIGICYLVCAFLFLHTHRWIGRVMVGGLTALYLALLYRLPVHLPGCEPGVKGDLSPFCNACAYVDYTVLGTRFMHMPTDPEGILSTCSAVLTAWLGVETGFGLIDWRNVSPDGWISTYVIDRLDVGRQYGYMLVQFVSLGSLFTVVGGVLSIWLPLNKEIWSVSFAFLTAGIGILCMGVFWAVIEPPWEQGPGGGSLMPREGYHDEPANAPLLPLQPSEQLQHAQYGSALEHDASPAQFPVESQWRSVLHVCIQPLVWLGRNPIMVFVCMILLEIVLLDWVTGLSYEGGKVNLWVYLYWHAFESWIPYRKLASLIVALVHLLLWEVVTWYANRRQFYVKL